MTIIIVVIKLSLLSTSAASRIVILKIPFINFITFADFRTGHDATINLLLYYKDVRACTLVNIKYSGITIYNIKQ